MLLFFFLLMMLVPCFPEWVRTETTLCFSQSLWRLLSKQVKLCVLIIIFIYWLKCNAFFFKCLENLATNKLNENILYYNAAHKTMKAESLGKRHVVTLAQGSILFCLQKGYLCRQLHYIFWASLFCFITLNKPWSLLLFCFTLILF